MRTLDLRLYFSDMKDPRIDRKKLHSLEDIVFISIAAIICGAEGWNEIEEYGKSKKEWLSTILPLPNGIPTHDTFNRFFAALDPEEFEGRFIKWVQSISAVNKGEVVCIDGKTMRGSRGSGTHSATHIVSAWASDNEAILGQLKVDQKTNEITVIPELLNSLLITGSIITIDAMGCQREIAKQIREKEADYVLGVKENQGELLQNIQDSFRFKTPYEVSEECDCDHGRVETRKCSVICDLDMIEKKEAWKDLKSIIRIESTRFIKATGKQEQQIRYYISSLEVNAAIMNKAIRSHWGIENKVHWVLDVAFHEDMSRKRAGAAAENYSTLNRIALNLLKKDATKIGIHGKRLKAGWDNHAMLGMIKF